MVDDGLFETFDFVSRSTGGSRVKIKTYALLSQQLLEDCSRGWVAVLDDVSHGGLVDDGQVSWMDVGDGLRKERKGKKKWLAGENLYPVQPRREGIRSGFTVCHLVVDDSSPLSFSGDSRRQHT